MKEELKKEGYGKLVFRRKQVMTAAAAPYIRLYIQESQSQLAPFVSPHQAYVLVQKLELAG